MSYPTDSGVSYTTKVDNTDVIYAEDVNDLQTEVTSIKTKVGVDGSAVTTSHDYKLSGVTGSNKAVPNNGGTLISPKITVGSDAVGDIHYTSNVDGTQSRLAIVTGKILKSTGGVLVWEDEIAVVNASTTAKGIVEAGTSAEVTAGTATGGTGAVLVVTPDALAASTPVFNGSGLTSIPRFLTSGAPATTTTNTTATVLTYAVTGGTLGTNKGIKIRATVTSAITASNNGATYTIQYGGTTIGVLGYAGSTGSPTVTALSVIDILLLGSGATGTQRASVLSRSNATSGSGGLSVSNDAQSYSLSVDSTASQNITISCTAGASVTGTFVDYFIEKIQ